jgi:ribosomal protein S16
VLMIRLSRTGARKQPQYRVVVIEKERARNGRPVEVVGTYNPRTSPASIELKRERIVLPRFCPSPPRPLLLRLPDFFDASRKSHQMTAVRF